MHSARGRLAKAHGGSSSDASDLICTACAPDGRLAQMAQRQTLVRFSLLTKLAVFLVLNAGIVSGREACLMHFKTTHSLFNSYLFHPSLPTRSHLAYLPCTTQLVYLFVLALYNNRYLQVTVSQVRPGGRNQSLHLTQTLWYENE